MRRSLQATVDTVFVKPSIAVFVQILEWNGNVFMVSEDSKLI